jgi:peptide/nickel transport system permease protein
MGRFVLRRTGAALIAVLLASVIVFIGVQSLPGDASLTFAGETAPPNVVQAIVEKYHLDDPLVLQYTRWLSLSLRGDLGTSVRGDEVSDVILQRLPVTIELALLSVLIAVAIGIPAGVLAARYRGGIIDYAANAVSLIGLSVPNFWLGLMGILVFAVQLGWLPASGYVSFFDDPLENLRRMAMPSIVLGTTFSAIVMRQTRSSMIEALNSDYVRTAWAKGMTPGRVIWRHALRNSLTIVLTVVGLQLGRLLSGSVVIESVFVLPGFGNMLLEGVLKRDFPIVQGGVLVAAVGYVLINLATDVAYSVVNPRIRLSGRQG